MNEHDPAILDYLGRLYGEDRRAFAFGGRTRGEFTQWLAAARPRLRELVGLGRIEASLGGFQPSVSLGDAEDLGAYTRSRGMLHTEPGFDVPFWYLEPNGPGPHPLALFPHGHYADHGLDKAVGIAQDEADRIRIAEQDRDVAVQAVERGFAAIAPATRGFPPACIPDVTERHGGRNCRSHLLHALLAGRTVIGERVWDLERLIDWAAARPGIDASTILVMGNSGGGVATLYAAACDERVSVAVASCSFCTYVGRNGVIHHCDCNAVPGILEFGEFHDVAGLIAPRRLLVIHGREDSLFPEEEVERAVAGLRRIFDTAEAYTRFQHRYGAGGHRFYKDLMWPFVLNAT
ncbi:MAG: acetylxylan esterase [Candidatus Hydrogenedentes bacterium]|nr:acetylxylan esterase [Candidatus Hydrogenedentota bacterium]